MTVAANYENPTGKYNLRSSFYKWLQAQVLRSGATPDTDFKWDLDNIAQPSQFPRVGVQEQPFFSPGGGFFDNDIFPMAGAGLQQQGAAAAALFLLEIQTDQAADPNALRKVYQIRDRVKRALVKAGTANLAGTVEVPPITVLDYTQTTPADTGIIATVPVGQETAFQERYIPPAPTQPNIHTVQLLVRLEWFEMTD